jgi:YVTN family beta-propeller protein
MKLFLVLLVAGLFFSSCEPTNEVILPPSEFSMKVKPILVQNCTESSCHGGSPQGFGGGLDLTSYEGIFRGSRYGTVVVAGNAFMSHLVQTINQTDTTVSPISSVPMPASRNPLHDEDVHAIVEWINNGARDDNGGMPFPEPRPLGKVFFTSQSVDLVGVLDVQTGLIMRYITVGNRLPFTSPPQSPHNVQIDDQGRYYYVTMIRGNELKKYDAATNQLLAVRSAGTSPAHVVITQDGSKAYVTNFDQSVGRVLVFNTANLAVTDTIKDPIFMKATHGARLSHDGRYLYIGNNGTDLLTIIRTENDSIIMHVPIANNVPPFGSFIYKPYQIAVREDDRFIYITCNGNGLVSVIERNGDTFTRAGLVTVGANPLQCEVTRDQRYVLVCNRGSGTVSRINTATLQVTTIDSVGRQPHGIDITEDSRIAYVTCENVLGADPPHHPITGSTDPGFIAVIDIENARVIRRIEVGGFAAGVSIYPGKGN